jgi:flagellar biosynthesis/type III secretory pathway M-ring protein FliF/YscJ
VAGVTGFDEQRGDQIVVETLPFESTSDAEPPAVSAPAQPAAPRSLLDLKQPAVLGVAAALVVLIALLVFVLMRRRPGATAAQTEPALAAGAAAKPALPGMTADERVAQQIADNEAEQKQLEADALRGIKLPPNSRKSEALVKHIRESVHHDAVNATNVLRTWITDADARKQSS